MGAYDTWRAAMRVFAYPENQLLPGYYVPVAGFFSPTHAYLQLVDDLRKAIRVTPGSARSLASDYLQRLRGEAGVALPPELVAPDFALTEQRSDADLVGRQALVSRLFGGATDPYTVPQYLPEVFWLVPMAVGLRLQEDRHYLAALDWFQTVYAFNLPPDKRKIYRGLALEGSISSAYERAPDWLVTELNPHVIARTRNNAYTRFTVLSIARCFLDYADAQFAGNLPEATALARSLYETALELLDVPDVAPETGPTIPFPANPVWEALRLQAQVNLAKIHNGLNIAGLPAAPQASGAAPAALPSQYRSAVLVERAKSLAGMAQQMEAAFLNALERSDAEAYSLMQAGHDLQVAQASVTLSDLKVADAAIAVTMAGLQQEKAQVEFDHFDGLLRGGLNEWEEGALGAQIAAVALRAAAAASLISPSTVVAPGSAFSSLADVASATSQLLQMQASFERRKEDWQLQKNLADKDLQIGAQQILHAANQQQVALQERNLAGLQLDHAGAVLNFLANKFTNAELFEWMSGVLGRVYAYVLQQATAVAQLAEAQLAFERQEAAQGFVRADYWQDAPENAADAGSAGATDRRGMTGSARLLQDIVRLDQYAFETERRKLHLTQTLSVAELAPLELQQLRETGVLVLRTPLDLFDREFPGHYLRLLKRVRVSLVALVPPVRGVRATLSASGLSRVVIGGDQFRIVTLARPPEEIAFTSPLNATGLFELEPESGLLLPFEGMGLDAVWRLELPKAANPFDFQTIADVLLTFEYTALGSADYRQQVLRALDGRFSADRAFSVRDQFPDAWYRLNNPDADSGEGTPMRAQFSIGRDDFAPHIQQLVVDELTLFCLRAEGFAQELPIAALEYRAPGGQPVATGPVRTTGGVVGTRRPNGAAWRALAGRDPVGDWSLTLEDTPAVRSCFADGSIRDLVLVMSVGGVTPPWP